MLPKPDVTPAAVDTGTSTGIVDDLCIDFPRSIQSEHSLWVQSWPNVALRETPLVLVCPPNRIGPPGASACSRIPAATIELNDVEPEPAWSSLVFTALSTSSVSCMSNAPSGSFSVTGVRIGDVLHEGEVGDLDGESYDLFVLFIITSCESQLPHSSFTLEVSIWDNESPTPFLLLFCNSRSLLLPPLSHAETLASESKLLFFLLWDFTYVCMSIFVCPKSNGPFGPDRCHTALLIRLTRSPKPVNSLLVECFGVWLPVESKSSVLPAELRSSRFSVEDSRLVRRNVKLLLRPKRDLQTQACYN